MEVKNHSIQVIQRKALLAIAIGTALSLVGDSSIYAVLPTHVEAAGITLASVGILLSANRWVRLPLNGPGGFLYERWPRRRLFVPALFLGAFSTALYAFTYGFWPLLVGRLLWGISWVGIWVGGNTIALDISAQQTRGKVVGWYNFAFFIGAGGGAFVGGVLTDWVGYHSAMGIGALLTFLGGLTAFWLLPETRGMRTPPKSKPVSDAGSNPKGTHTGRRRRGEIMSAIALLGVDRLVRAGFMTATVGLFLQTQFGEHVEFLGYSVGVATLTGTGLGLATFITAGTTPLIGGISDSLQNRWLVAAGGLLPGILGFGLLSFGTPISILFGMVLIASTSGSNYNLSTSLTGDLSPEGQHSRWLGILFTLGDFTSAVGPPLAFALIPIVEIRGLYWIASGLLISMVFVALWWGKQQLMKPVEVN